MPHDVDVPEPLYPATTVDRLRLAADLLEQGDTDDAEKYVREALEQLSGMTWDGTHPQWLRALGVKA